MSTRDDLPPETAGRSAASPSARLIRYAAGRMPPGLAERLEEEWIADLAEQHGALSRMRFALGCWWAKEVIGHEPHLYGARLSAASHGKVDVITPLYPSLLPRRAAVFLVIVFLHIAAALALIYAIKVRELPIPQPPMIGRLYFDPKLVTPPLPLPRPQLGHDRVRILVLPPFGPLQSSSADSLQPIAQPTSSLPTPGPAQVRMSGGIGRGFPNTADFYPPSAMRVGEAGLTAVNVCVDDHGRLTTDPKIAVSSGSPRLDGGALALARAGSGHYRSTTENGRAISACFQIGVRFTLKS
jgi:TonB family protein